MNLTYISRTALSAFIATMLTMILVLASFFMLEPSVGRAAVDSDVFEVRQEITAEISFETTASDVVMSPSLAGLTGGESNGSTYVVVNTNNATGYNMTIAFSSTTAMLRNGGGGYISNYNPASVGVPDYGFGPETYAQFGYTVVASSSADLDPSFADNGSVCNTGSGNTVNSCWLDPDDAAEVIINRSTATPLSGATTTIAFRVSVPNNPVPAISTGFYTATATLTATTN